MVLKFKYYENGQIELVEQEEDGSIIRYIALWNNKSDLNDSLEEVK